jgi:hypothetical protein
MIFFSYSFTSFITRGRLSLVKLSEIIERDIRKKPDHRNVI